MTSSWTLLDAGGNDWMAERACQYGDGLFETIAVHSGHPCLWKYHLDRLLLGCRRLGLPAPDTGALREALGSASEGLDSVAIRLFWTAGRSARGYRRPRPVEPQGLLQRFPWTPPSAGRPWHLRICAHRLSENPSLAGIKHMNRLDQVIGRAEWDDPDIDEGLMLGQDGRLVCGTMSNLLIEHADRLATPAIDDAGVAGVVRRCLLEVSRSQATPIEQGRLTLEDLRSAVALYMTNALVGVRRVARCGELHFDLDRPEHPLIGRVRRLAVGSSGAIQARR